MAARIVVALLLLLVSSTAVALSPLEPADTSSPRATIASFLAITDDVMSRYIEYRKAPSPASQKALQQSVAKGYRLLDLSAVPPATRDETARDRFVLLWEVLARVQLPDPAAIPATFAATAGGAKAAQATRWRIPGTEITITRVAQGDRAGEFLFSPDTVDRLPAFYEISRASPYLRTVPGGNVYGVLKLVTGWMIPVAWVEALPDWANTPIFGQLLWKSIVVLVLFGLAFWIAIAIWRWARHRPWDSSLGTYLRYLSAPATILILASLLRYFATNQIAVSGSAAQVADYVLELAAAAGQIWIVWLTAGRVADAIIALPKIHIKSVDAHLIRLAARTTGLGVMLVLVFHTANRLGIPVYGLVAGAGVGGLAVALAARSTLENFLGTLNLYADHPVRVGDLCRYGEDSPNVIRLGTVEEIGLRSTLIRGIDRTITTIPNAEFSNMPIVNLTRRDRMLFRTTIGLRYETTPDQLRFVVAQLREMLLAHPRIAEDPARGARGRFRLERPRRGTLRLREDVGVE